jgi:hypothetical protein
MSEKSWAMKEKNRKKKKNPLGVLTAGISWLSKKGKDPARHNERGKETTTHA